MKDWVLSDTGQVGYSGLGGEGGGILTPLIGVGLLLLWVGSWVFWRLSWWLWLFSWILPGSSEC